MPKWYSEDYGIRCNPDSKFEFFCPSDNCDFHSRLPIQVVDQALYANPPTLLIGTIDKFARLTWKAEASAFFGNGKKLPPSLMIQDELHLISGPLRTIAGIYEAGFDTIMEVMGGKPKVIAATATIRSANQQVNRLFGRKVNIFPPVGTEESDSFFSKEDADNSGRLYIGIKRSGHTGQTGLVQAGAAVLQAPHELGFEDSVLDSYWTLPVYHNSRRELGKTITLARDDIPERIKVISSDPRSIDYVEELSSTGVRPCYCAIMLSLITRCSLLVPAIIIRLSPAARISRYKHSVEGEWMVSGRFSSGYSGSVSSSFRSAVHFWTGCRLPLLKTCSNLLKVT